MVNNFMTEIKSYEWRALNNKEYETTKHFDLYVKNAMVYCYDSLGNALSMGIKIEDFSITFISVKAEDVRVMILIPLNIEEVIPSDSRNKQYPSNYLNEDKGYLEMHHLDEEGNTILKDMVETHSVSLINSSIQLTEMPDKYYGLILESKDGIQLNKVYNIDELEKKSCSYYIGKNNMIYCSSDLIGKYITIKYKGLGKTIINCNMIYYRDKINNVPVLLEELIDNGQEALKLIGTLGDAVQIISKLEEDIKNAKIQDNKLIETIENAHDTNLLVKETINSASSVIEGIEESINTATNKKEEIKEDINASINEAINRKEEIETAIKESSNIEEALNKENVEANRIQAILHKENEEANRIQPILHQDVLDAKDFVENYGDITEIGDRVNAIESNKQDKRDDSLTTQSKEVVGAINELKINKIDKIAGKGLSTNDFTNNDKENIKKIAGIESTINELKTNKVDKVPGKGLSTNDFTNELLNKLNTMNNGVIPVLSSPPSSPVEGQMWIIR